MSVVGWCACHGITKANYYYRLRRVREACLETIREEMPAQQIVSVQPQLLRPQEQTERSVRPGLDISIREVTWKPVWAYLSDLLRIPQGIVQDFSVSGLDISIHSCGKRNTVTVRVHTVDIDSFKTDILLCFLFYASHKITGNVIVAHFKPCALFPGRSDLDINVVIIGKFSTSVNKCCHDWQPDMLTSVWEESGATTQDREITLYDIVYYRE